MNRGLSDYSLRNSCWGTAWSVVHALKHNVEVCDSCIPLPLYNSPTLLLHDPALKFCRKPCTSVHVHGKLPGSDTRAYHQSTNWTDQEINERIVYRVFFFLFFQTKEKNWKKLNPVAYLTSGLTAILRAMTNPPMDKAVATARNSG